jgi:hypothetical protein
MCTGNGRPDPISPPQPPPRRPGKGDWVPVVSTSDDAAPVDEASGSGAVTPLASGPLDPSGAPTDLFQAIDRHPCALVRHLDTYLAAVARELQVNGVLTAAPSTATPRTC